MWGVAIAMSCILWWYVEHGNGIIDKSGVEK